MNVTRMANDDHRFVALPEDVDEAAPEEREGAVHQGDLIALRPCHVIQSIESGG